MRIVWLFTFACTLACSSEKMPPGLGDFDGSPPVGVGGGIQGGDPDGAAGDGGFVIVSALNPAQFFVSGTSLYYTNHGTGAADGTVSTVPLGGGKATDLATGLDEPSALTVANGVVYFTLARANGTGGVFSVPITGGNVSPIQDSVTGTLGIATDANNVYWTLDSDTSGIGGTVVEALAFGTTTPKQVLANGSTFVPAGLVLSGSDVYVPGQGTEAAVYWGTASGSTNLTPLDTPQVVNFADVAVSVDTVFATIDDVAPVGAIVAFPRHGGVGTTIVSSLNHPQRLALDGRRLYFTDPNDGIVWVKDVTTTDAPIQFATGLSMPLAIVVADAVYVGTTNAILRIPKL